ncbi:TPA: hypothetical protein ACWL6U_004093 [Morganella morganii]
MTSMDRGVTFVTNDAPIRMQSGQPLGFAGSTGAAIIVIDGSQFQTTPSEPSQNKIGEIAMGRKEFYLGIAGVLLTVMVTVIGSSWAISNRVNDSVNDARKELQNSINANRQEILALINSIDSRNNDRFNRIDSQFDKLELRIDKVESKMDGYFNEVNKNLNEIKASATKSK